ncbi:MAG: hypothetical protein Q8L34_03330 [Candidatus Woesearchaeota archaeon]|nr:hypothetical protein [Candidatus Woesearchaeota archaeon]
MRIDFNDTIEGKDRLQPFTTEPIVEVVDGVKKINPSIDIGRLVTTLVDVLESSLTQNAFKVNRSTANTLLVSSPLLFSMHVRANQYDSRVCDYELLGKETIRHQRKFLGIPLKPRETTITTYRQIPKVYVRGSILFEQLQGIEPSPVLDILTKLGYTPLVIPTPEELARSSDSSNRSHNQNDPLERFLEDMDIL